LLEFIWKLIIRMIPEDLREENHKESIVQQKNTCNINMMDIRFPIRPFYEPSIASEQSLVLQRKISAT